MDITSYSEYISTYLLETKSIAESIDQEAVAETIVGMKKLREGRGRLFILGVGGSAGNASHAVNDFRKIAGIETYAPTDNVSELTARVNDESWEVVFSHWLEVSQLSNSDALLIFSVGGGTSTTSVNLVKAMELAQDRGAKIYSIVSRDGGAAKAMSDVCILVPVVNPDRITPHAEGWQGVVWHMIVTALA